MGVDQIHVVGMASLEAAGNLPVAGKRDWAEPQLAVNGSVLPVPASIGRPQYMPIGRASLRDRAPIRTGARPGGLLAAWTSVALDSAPRQAHGGVGA